MKFGPADLLNPNVSSERLWTLIDTRTTAKVLRKSVLAVQQNFTRGTYRTVKEGRRRYTTLAWLREALTGEKAESKPAPEPPPESGKEAWLERARKFQAVGSGV